MQITKEQKGKSYTAIIQMAKSLFWKYGIKRVTVEDVCKEARVSKMTFYRNFDNKNDLAKKVMIHETEMGLRKYTEIMDPDIPFTEKIHQLVELKHQSIQDISEEFLRDVYQMEDIDLKNHMDEYRQNVLGKLRRELKKAQENGEIREDLKIDFVMYMLNGLNEKMLDQNLISMYNNPHDLIMELTNFFFYGLLTDKGK